jgi:FtsP/CotA-like multicopper oxidase with cupredoxin domain
MRVELNRRSFLRSAIAAAGLTPATRLLAREDGHSRRVEIDLEAAEGWVRVGERGAWLYAYNSTVPGPRIEVVPGDEVRIRLINRLREPTNLHFHGLHLPPTGRADNSFLLIPPGEALEYEFAIPKDHACGTFWYHPHVHGSAARQVSRGLAGALVVRGGLDEIPEIARAPEFLIPIQDFDLDPRGVPREPAMMERLIGREGGMVTLDGLVRPRIGLEEGGWIRLRLINASASRFYRLAIEEHLLVQIASDGGPLGWPQPRDEILLTPGERVEVMVEGNRPPGSYRLWNLPYDRGGMMAGGRFRQPEALAAVEYIRSAAEPWGLPAGLIPVEALPEPARKRWFILGQGMGMMGRGPLTINGRAFDARAVDTFAPLGDTEDWEFVNTTTMDHPMHIHTNPFQAVDSRGDAQPAWKDVVLVKAGERAAIRTRFADYSGRTFYHCHILDHEDLGMMGVLEIQPDPATAAPGGG